MALKVSREVEGEFMTTLSRLENLNSHFEQKRTDEAEREVRSVFYGQEGQLLAARTIESNMAYFSARFMAIVDQAEQNPAWKDLRRKVKEGKRPYEAASDKEWQRAPRTLKKTMQEILGNELFRMAFQRDELDSADIVLDAAEFSPRRLAIMGIDPPVQPDRRLSRLEKLKSMIPFIPVVQERMGEFEPLRFGNERDPIRLKYFRLMRNPSGYVMGTQSLGRGEKNDDDKVIFGTDLYGSRRRISHIKEGYDKERATLAEIVAITQQVVLKINTDWPNAKKEIPEIREKLLGLVDRLKYVRNKHKLIMRNRISKSVDIKFVRTVNAKFDWDADDSRKMIRPAQQKMVYNPKAAVSSLRSLVDLAGKRKNEMAAISRYLGNDEARVSDYIVTQERLFGRFYESVMDLHYEFGILDVERELPPRELAKIKGNLQALASQCDPKSRTPFMTFFQPHLAMAEKMGPHLSNAAQMLDDGDRVEAAREFIKAFLIAKIENFYVEVERFYKTELPPAKEEQNFTDLLEKIEKLRTLISNKEIGAFMATEMGDSSDSNAGADAVNMNIENEESEAGTEEHIPTEVTQVFLETPEYHKIWGGLYHLLNSLRWQARKGQAAQKQGIRIYYKDSGKAPEEISEAEAKALMEEVLLKMKNRIKTMRFEDLIYRGREEETVEVSEDAASSE